METLLEVQKAAKEKRIIAVDDSGNDELRIYVPRDPELEEQESLERERETIEKMSKRDENK